jgi:hypothetical protein
MPLTNEQQKANEAYYLYCLKNKTELYVWRDTGNVYTMISGKIIQPATMKGFVELSAIVSRNFAKIFIDLPSRNYMEIEGAKFYFEEELNKDKLLDYVEGLKHSINHT